MEIEKISSQLDKGRNYLMGIRLDELTVEDALEAFGFGKNGLKSN